MNFLRYSRHSRSSRQFGNFFNPQPVENFVGTCPIYGHKYFETPIQKYGPFNKWEITVEKRRVEWNADYGTFGKMDPSQQHLLIQDIMRKRLFTVEWERWLRSKRLRAPTDKEIAINTIKKNETAAKGKALENMYNKVNKLLVSLFTNSINSLYEGSAPYQKVSYRLRIKLENLSLL